MSASSTAAVPTTRAVRYLQQLCKHWFHNLSVDYTADCGTAVFLHDARGADWPGDATVTFVASDPTLGCCIDASAPGQLEGLKKALVQHINRFAFCKAPLTFNWRTE